MAFPLTRLFGIITLRTGLVVVADGQDTETPPMPYILATLIQEPKYKSWQTLRYDIETSGEPGRIYVNPTVTQMQFSVVYPAQKVAACRAMARLLYNYFSTDGFELALKRIDNVSLVTASEIRELKVAKANFFERQNSFDCNLLWADSITESFVDTIESADVQQEDPVAGQ